MKENERPKFIPKEEFGMEYVDAYDRMLFWHSVGYGKETQVNLIASKYIQLRDDLELAFSAESERYVPIKEERAGFIGKFHFKLIKTFDYFIMKNKTMEDYLMRVWEDMDTRRERLPKLFAGKYHVNSEERKHGVKA